MSGVKLRKRAYFETTKIEELEKQLGL